MFLFKLLRLDVIGTIRACNSTHDVLVLTDRQIDGIGVVRGGRRIQHRRRFGEIRTSRKHLGVRLDVRCQLNSRYLTTMDRLRLESCLGKDVPAIPVQ